MHNKGGDNHSEVLPEEGKWGKILKESQEISLNLLPKAMQDNHYILAMFLIIFPYRARTDVIKYLHSVFAGPHFDQGST